jgi:hypothetical protein
MQEDRRADDGHDDAERQLGNRMPRAPASAPSTNVAPSSALIGTRRDGRGRRCRRVRMTMPNLTTPACHRGTGRAVVKAIRRFTRSTSTPMEGLGLAEQQAVEAWSATAARSDDQRTAPPLHLGPARAGQAAQHPQREVAQLAVVAGEGVGPSARLRRR